MTVNPTAAIDDRVQDTWLLAQQASLTEFAALTGRQTNPQDCPLAREIIKNIPVYEGAALDQAYRDPAALRAITAEWAWVFRDGPGVIAIRDAVDTQIVDRATSVFEELIEKERESGAGGGDHFAKPGANDRVWNALQKHCLADPENFARYYAAAALHLPSLAWLGPGYQMTAQVNRVNPGGAAQSAHRDYHLGFMTTDRAAQYPASCHALSPFLTLQGAVAHCDMPLESGPTKLLPHSQLYSHGYIAFPMDAFQAHFEEHHVQLPLKKGDAVFFNPALMHAAGANTSNDIRRIANLLQVGSAFGRSIETVDRVATSKALYPVLRAAGLADHETANAVHACAEGYPFPTNLDTDPPIGGLVPQTQAEFMLEALAAGMEEADFNARLEEMVAKRAPV